jgi:hypothetical protein
MELITLKDINTQKEKWNKQKSKGKLMFILTYGVLLWGVIISTTYSIVTIFLISNYTSYSILGIVFRFIAYALIWGFCGILFTNGLWNSNIKKFDSK